MTQQIDDFIVIGSGFGGAIPASHLTDAGFKVTVLERGPWRDTVPVRSMGIPNRASYPQGWKFYSHILRTLHAPFLPKNGLTVNKRGMYEFFVNKGIYNVCTAAVGGGSHAYSGLHQRATVENYWDGHSDSVSSQSMEKHYQAVMARFGSRQRTAEDKVPNTTTERFSDSDTFSDDNGYDAPAFGLLLPEEPGRPKKIVNEDGIERYESAYDDDSFLGSERGVKSTLDFVYLAPAMKKGLVVRDMCEVTGIQRLGEGEGSLYRVDAVDHHAMGSQSFYARKVILAAGAMNTLKLLFHSRDVTGGLIGMPALGKGVGANGDYGGYWSLNDQSTDFTQGLTIHGPVGIKGVEKTYLVLGGITGLQHIPLPGRLKNRLRRDAFLGGMGADAADGTASYPNGRLRIEYNAANSQIFKDIKRAMQLAQEASGKTVHCMETPFTVHTCGGARLGSTIENGVVDGNGEVFDNPGLYVTDAAALPGAPGGPPSMSIAAWAAHVAERIIERHPRVANPKRSKNAA